ncbi:MAG TPA: SHOCT domain-containing protein [Jiangellaceae bacterium]|nr:SHOCT domain-containing protein [Jiangellaceae bacterium]
MGLVRGMARTAVVAGTATAVSNRVSRRQARRWQEQEYAQAPEPPAQQPAQWGTPPPTPAPQPAAAGVGEQDPLMAKLEGLAQLRSQGVLTEEEFAAAKAKLLGL